MSTIRCLTALFATSMITGGMAQCDQFNGDWFDTATEDVMKITEAGCTLTTKYGTATVSGSSVVPNDGLLFNLKATGKFDDRLGVVEWSNGVKWSKSMTREVEKRLTTLESSVSTLESTVTTLGSAVQVLQQQMASLLNSSSVLGPVTTPLVPVPGPANTSNPTSVSSAEFDDLRIQIAAINATIAALNSTGPPGAPGSPGRDGFCTIEPNATDVYIPVTRFVYRKSTNANRCTYNGRTPGAGDSIFKDCRWASNMYEQPMSAYVGDTLVFWKGSGKDADNTIYQFDDEKAFDDCDFDRSKLIAGVPNFLVLAAAGKNFTMQLTEAKVLYFGADVPNAKNLQARKASCVGRSVKISVNVMNATEEVMTTCPVYDPSKYGVSQGGQADSKSVERLKGAVAAIGRQLISYEFRLQERVREQGQSGITVVRSTNQGTDSYHEASFAGSRVCGMHDHANSHHTIGMGEFGAVLNGVQFLTRHNDYSLSEADHTIALEEYTKTWPPRTRLMEYPPVPPAVLNAGDVTAQSNEMREWFRAWHTQNTTHRDYRPYFKPVLCYLEGTWVNSQENIAEPFASERHHIDADSWTDLNAKMNFYINSGQKSSSENIPYLPTSFRGMHENSAGETFEPKMAQWFYRIVCKKLDIEIPTTRFRVKNELHLQVSGSRPMTRKQLTKNSKALFDLNPTSEANYDPKTPWPKGKTDHEFIDELMEQVSGFDGPNQVNFPDESFGPRCTIWNGRQTLNTAKYSRYYSHSKKDAMGRSGKKRGFNDLMFAAQTTNKRVSPMSVCAEVASEDQTDPGDAIREQECKALKKEECENRPHWSASELLNNASSAKCVANSKSCVYKKCWEQRWTYAIPLEIVYQTPLTEWNPYDIPYYQKSEPEFAQVAGGGRNGKTNSPFKGSNQANFFRTPDTFFKDPTNTDPADTSGGTTFAEDRNGVTRAVRASGHWIIFPELQGIGKIRQRYPIFPVHEHGSTIWKETKAIEELIMGRDSKQEIKDIIAETRAEAYGTELKLLDGGGHIHQIHISPAEVQKLEAGTITEILKSSSEANGHTHRVNVCCCPLFFILM